MDRRRLLQQMFEIDRIREAARPAPLHVEHVFGQGFFYEERSLGTCGGTRIWSPDNPMKRGKPLTESIKK